jgi:hypothetical protein
MQLEHTLRTSTIHALRICGFASTDRVAGYLRAPATSVERSLSDLETAGLVRFRSGRVSGWILTPQGRSEHAQHVAAALNDRRWQEPTRQGYQEFLSRNRELKQICTAWQLKSLGDGTTTPNDHSDPAYDAAVVADLADLHRRSDSMLAKLSEGLDRFGNYRPRLDEAVVRLQAGDTTAFATPMSASYHCVWMELHEDLLVTLDRERDEVDGH